MSKQALVAWGISKEHRFVFVLDITNEKEPNWYNYTQQTFKMDAAVLKYDLEKARKYASDYTIVSRKKWEECYGKINYP